MPLLVDPRDVPVPGTADGGDGGEAGRTQEAGPVIESEKSRQEEVALLAEEGGDEGGATERKHLPQALAARRRFPGRRVPISPMLERPMPSNFSTWTPPPTGEALKPRLPHQRGIGVTPTASRQPKGSGPTATPLTNSVDPLADAATPAQDVETLDATDEVVVGNEEGELPPGSDTQAEGTKKSNAWSGDSTNEGGGTEQILLTVVEAAPNKGTGTGKRNKSVTRKFAPLRGFGDSGDMGGDTDSPHTPKELRSPSPVLVQKAFHFLNSCFAPFFRRKASGDNTDYDHLDDSADPETFAKHPEWVKLTHEEALRRKLLILTKQAPWWMFVARFSGTIFEKLITDPIFWLTFAIYGVTSHLSCNDVTLARLTAGQVGFSASACYFFLIFYQNQAYARYFNQYFISMSCEGRIFDVCCLGKAWLDRQKLRRLMRYVNAAHMLGYSGLGMSTYDGPNFFRILNNRYRLLTKTEMARMESIGYAGGSCYRECIVYALQTIWDAVKEDGLDYNIAVSFNAQITTLRSKIASLYDYDDQPIPFFYVHLLTVFTSMYVAMFAYYEGAEMFWRIQDIEGHDGVCRAEDYAVGAYVILIEVVFVLGLRSISMQMQNPYGNDVIDFSVMHYITFTLRQSRRICFAKRETGADEQELAKDRPPIGRAWMDEYNKLTPRTRRALKTSEDEYQTLQTKY